MSDFAKDIPNETEIEGIFTSPELMYLHSLDADTINPIEGYLVPKDQTRTIVAKHFIKDLEIKLLTIEKNYKVMLLNYFVMTLFSNFIPWKKITTFTEDLKFEIHLLKQPQFLALGSFLTAYSRILKHKIISSESKKGIKIIYFDNVNLYSETPISKTLLRKNILPNFIMDVINLLLKQLLYQ